MRIRKRSVPFPFSSLCPTIPPDFQLKKVPSTEEQLEPDPKTDREGADQEQQKEAKEGDPSFVAVKEEESTHLHHHESQTQTSSNPSPPLPPNLEVNRHRPSSDLQLTIVRVKDGWICSDGLVGGREEQKTSKYESCCMYPNTPSQAEKGWVQGLQGEEETKGKRWRVLFNNSRNASSVDVKANDDEIEANGLLPSSSSQVVGRWCEGEKAFPLKKRRRSFETTMVDKEKKMMRTILKTKTNKRFVDPEDYEDEDEDEEERKVEGLRNSSGGGRSNNSLKKRGSTRGVVIMEGSRCSRVNGRGWRCCQPTLVGYSLCEHHLGKGRLRSMNTVRTRDSSIISAAHDMPRSSLSSSSSSSVSKYEEEGLLDEDEEEEEERKPSMNTKERKKIGLVKARSIKSLLSSSTACG